MSSRYFDAMEASQLQRKNEDDVRKCRLLTVREQERQISNQRCKKYRDVIDRLKRSKLEAKKREKIQFLSNQLHNLTIECQNSLLNSGQSHFGAKILSNTLEAKRINETTKLNESKARDKIRVQKSVSILRTIEKEKENKTNRMKKMIESKLQFIAVDRENAKAHAESQNASAMQKFSPSKSPFLFDQSIAHQNSLAIHERGYKPVNARIIRHGDDQTLITNKSLDESQLITKRHWSRVMSEFSNNLKTYERGIIANQFIRKTKTSNTLESILEELDTIDRCPERQSIPRNVKAVKPFVETQNFVEEFVSMFGPTEPDRLPDVSRPREIIPYPISRYQTSFLSVKPSATSKSSEPTKHSESAKSSMPTTLPVQTKPTSKTFSPPPTSSTLTVRSKVVGSTTSSPLDLIDLSSPQISSYARRKADAPTVFTTTSPYADNVIAKDQLRPTTSEQRIRKESTTFSPVQVPAPKSTLILAEYLDSSHSEASSNDIAKYEPEASVGNEVKYKSETSLGEEFNYKSEVSASREIQRQPITFDEINHQRETSHCDEIYYQPVTSNEIKYDTDIIAEVKHQTETPVSTEIKLESNSSVSNEIKYLPVAIAEIKHQPEDSIRDVISNKPETYADVNYSAQHVSETLLQSVQMPMLTDTNRAAEAINFSTNVLPILNEKLLLEKYANSSPHNQNVAPTTYTNLTAGLTKEDTEALRFFSEDEYVTARGGDRNSTLLEPGERYVAMTDSVSDKSNIFYTSTVGTLSKPIVSLDVRPIISPVKPKNSNQSQFYIFFEDASPTRPQHQTASPPKSTTGGDVYYRLFPDVNTSYIPQGFSIPDSPDPSIPLEVLATNMPNDSQSIMQPRTVSLDHQQLTSPTISYMKSSYYPLDRRNILPTRSSNEYDYNLPNPNTESFQIKQAQLPLLSPDTGTTIMPTSNQDRDSISSRLTWSLDSSQQSATQPLSFRISSRNQEAQVSSTQFSHDQYQKVIPIVSTNIPKSNIEQILVSDPVQLNFPNASDSVKIEALNEQIVSRREIACHPDSNTIIPLTEQSLDSFIEKVSRSSTTSSKPQNNRNFNHANFNFNPSSSSSSPDFYSAESSEKKPKSLLDKSQTSSRFELPTTFDPQPTIESLQMKSSSAIQQPSLLHFRFINSDSSNSSSSGGLDNEFSTSSLNNDQRVIDSAAKFIRTNENSATAQLEKSTTRDIISTRANDVAICLSEQSLESVINDARRNNESTTFSTSTSTSPFAEKFINLAKFDASINDMSLASSSTDSSLQLEFPTSSRISVGPGPTSELLYSTQAANVPSISSYQRLVAHSLSLNDSESTINRSASNRYQQGEHEVNLTNQRYILTSVGALNDAFDSTSSSVSTPSSLLNEFPLSSRPVLDVAATFLHNPTSTRSAIEHPSLLQQNQHLDSTRSLGAHDEVAIPSLSEFHLLNTSGNQNPDNVSLSAMSMIASDSSDDEGEEDRHISEWSLLSSHGKLVFR